MTITGRLSIAAYATYNLGALTIIVSAVLGKAGQLIFVVAPVMCVAAIVLNTLSIGSAFRTGLAQFGRRMTFSRSERPIAFWAVIATSALVGAVYVIFFVFITKVGS